MFDRDTTTVSSGIVFWAVVFAVVSGLMFGWYAPLFEAQFGLPIIDIEGAFRPARTMELVSRYGEAGRQAYLVFLSIDCVFPVAGSLFVISMYRSLMRGLAVSESRQRVLITLAAVPAVCDLVENTFHSLLAVLYPRVQEPLARLAWCATAAKYSTLGLSCVTLFVLLALRLRQLYALRSSAS